MNEQDVRRIVREMIAGTMVAGFHATAGVRLIPPPEPTDCPDSGPAKEAVPQPPASAEPAPECSQVDGLCSHD